MKKQPLYVQPAGERIATQLKHSEELFRLLVLSVKDYAIFVLDPYGRVMTWNDGAQRIKGYKAEEIIGKHFSTFYTPEAKSSRHPDKELEIAREVGRYEEEGWRVRKDGSLFWANVVITALVEHGQIVGFAKVTRDLTERKRTQEELARSAKIAQDTAKQLAETNEELQRLTYVVSHELQAPLSTITRYSNLLSARYKDRLGSDANEFLHKINESVKLTARIIDDLWTYARVSKPEIVVEPVDTRALIARVYEEILVSGIPENKDLELHIGEVPDIVANPQQMKFLFREMIVNASRYRATSPVVININAKSEEQGWQFCFSDNGQGIDQVYSLDIFKLFFRIRGTIQPSATGMGLAMVNKIVRQHKGKIWFESRGAGTKFFVWLPRLKCSVSSFP